MDLNLTFIVIKVTYSRWCLALLKSTTISLVWMMLRSSWLEWHYVTKFLISFQYSSSFPFLIQPTIVVSSVNCCMWEGSEVYRKFDVHRVRRTGGTTVPCGTHPLQLTTVSDLQPPVTNTVVCLSGSPWSMPPGVSTLPSQNEILTVPLPLSIWGRDQCFGIHSNHLLLVGKMQRVEGVAHLWPQTVNQQPLHGLHHAWNQDEGSKVIQFTGQGFFGTEIMQVVFYSWLETL